MRYGAPAGPGQGSVSDIRAVAGLVQRSWALVQGRTDEVAKQLYTRLFVTAPDTQDLFPVNMQVQRSRVVRVIDHVVGQLEQPEQLRPFLAQLGRDHRKFGVLARHYRPFGEAFIAAVRHISGQEWSPGAEMAWARMFDFVGQVMSEAADAEPGPASWLGRVLEHHRPTRHIAVVRVQTRGPIPYRAGQYLSVETPRRPRAWRYLSPANAPNPEGILEFHVRAVPGGLVSPALVSHTQRGDVWQLGPAMGQIPYRIERASALLMVAGGTGVAPIAAILEAMAQRPNNPKTDVFLGGRRWEDLYALDAVRNMSYRHPWLNLVPVVEDDEDRGGAERGTLADVVTRYGAWSEHEVVVCGSPEMIRATVSRMLVAGTPVNRIHYDPFVTD